MIKIVSRYDSTKILKEVDGSNLCRANLSDSYLSGSNLSRADLSGSNLYRANLSDSNLSDSYLSGSNLSLADLSDSNLSGADFSDSNLSGANLYRADLSRANLYRANLSDSNLSGSNLSGSNLSGADLYRAKYSLLAALRSYWNVSTDSLILEFMRWDALSCGVEKMTAWAKGGSCPFDKLERDFNFNESRKLWKPGKPKMNHRQLFEALCAETKVKI